MQKSTLGPAGSRLAVLAALGSTAGTATPRPMPSAELAKPPPDLYLFGNQTRAGLATKKRVLGVYKLNVFAFYGVGIEKSSSVLLKLGK